MACVWIGIIYNACRPLLKKKAVQYLICRSRVFCPVQFQRTQENVDHSPLATQRVAQCQSQLLAITTAFYLSYFSEHLSRRQI